MRIRMKALNATLRTLREAIQKSNSLVLSPDENYVKPKSIANLEEDDSLGMHLHLSLLKEKYYSLIFRDRENCVY